MEIINSTIHVEFPNHEKEILHEASVILDELIAVAEQAGCGSVYNEVAEIGFDVTDVEDASDIIQQLFEFTNKLQLSE